MKRFLALFVSLFFLVSTASAVTTEANTTFDDVKIRRHKSPQDRILVDKSGKLTFDDGAKKLTFSSGAGDSFSAAYDDVTKVVFEVTSHMRGGAMSQIIGGLGGAAIGSKHVSDYWMIVQYKKADGTLEPVLLEAKKEIAGAVIEKSKAVFGERSTTAEFKEATVDIEKKELKDLQSKHDHDVNRQNHPMPEMKADKALVLVVCPALAARFAGKGVQYKLHANDRVVAVNKMGTYSFAYLDPGKYRMASQTENASGFDMELEAGKGYYFLQNTFMGAWKARTSLTRNTEELVMYEMDGAYFSDWKRKEK